MVAVGVEEKHPAEGGQPLRRLAVVDIAVAGHPVDGVGDRLSAHLKGGVQVIQTIAQIEHGIGGFVRQHPAQIPQAAMDVGDDEDFTHRNTPKKIKDSR